MAKISKKRKAFFENVDTSKTFTLEEAIEILKKYKYTKFDESIEYHVNLGVDPKFADQMVRGTTSLPFGLGKIVKVLVFAQGEKAKEATDSGADFCGAEELIEKIQKENFLDFHVALATPDMMKNVSKVAKILGPRGMMPNPKVGTVTNDIGKAVKEFKAGKVEFKVDKFGSIHVSIGKISFDAANIKENFLTLHREIVKAKPKSLKGVYLKSLYISSTMGPGLRIDANALNV